MSDGFNNMIAPADEMTHLLLESIGQEQSRQAETYKRMFDNAKERWEMTLKVMFQGLLIATLPDAANRIIADPKARHVVLHIDLIKGPVPLGMSRTDEVCEILRACEYPYPYQALKLLMCLESSRKEGRIWLVYRSVESMARIYEERINEFNIHKLNK